MPEPDDSLSIDTLLGNESPRADLGSQKPLMNVHFNLPGLMLLQHPRAESDAILSVSGLQLAFDAAEFFYDDFMVVYDDPFA